MGLRPTGNYDGQTDAQRERELTSARLKHEFRARRRYCEGRAQADAVRWAGQVAAQQAKRAART